MREAVIIRPFNDSLADAEGLLDVERETFDESPYAADEVQAMLARGAQQAWLAVGEDRIIGFVIAFGTNGLAGPCWEIDLLAVHPEWTGRGVATRLIQAAAAEGATLAPRARAAVATNNPGSARAFTRAGFQRDALCELFIFQPKNRTVHSFTAVGITVREVSGSSEIAPLLTEGLVQPGLGGQHSSGTPGAPIFLLAERKGQPAGYAELIQVQTLLYRGVWMESLVFSSPVVCAALVHAAVNWAVRAGLDEVGMMVPERALSLQDAFQTANFQSLGTFDWLVAGLPLPDLPFGLHRGVARETI
jgi:ribosomal protein S18 acetylase RimI-like enzyme